MDKNNEQAACNGDQHEEPVDNMDEEAAAKEKLTADPNKVKFTSVNLDGYDGKNGEAKVDIYVAQTTVGMGKEELMKYANEPFWVRLRMFLFVFFWVSWIAMLVGAVVIILLAPRCPPAPKLDWYQKTAIYEVDVETFKDSDGDGVGDFKGLISKLDFFKTQNIGTLLLGAFYESENDGITDHMQIDNRFGTMADFEELITKLNEKDIKLVIDFNPNHSSDKHKWFVDSAAQIEPYTDYYVWRNNSEIAINDWMNVTGDSAWYLNTKRQGYFFGTFGFDKPEFNLRNENVRQEMENILRFWLDKGVHGFKVVAASHLIEDKDFRDEPLGRKQSVGLPMYEDINHIYTLDQSENYELFAEWREILANFTESSGLRRILLAETSGSLNSSLLYYGNGTYTLSELPFNSQLTEVSDKTTGVELKETIETWAMNSPDNAWPTYLVGSKSSKRLASRVGEDLVDGIHMISILSKGTPITYYGDELGMTDLKASGKKTMPQSVMLWSNEINAGFSSGDGGLQVHPDYLTINVQVQEKDKQSHLNIFKRLLALRGQPALGFGMQHYPLVTNETFTMIRVRKGAPGYLVVINLGSTPNVVDLSGTDDHLPDIARVEIRSRNLIDGPLTEGDHPKVHLNNIPLEARQSVVISFVPQFKG